MNRKIVSALCVLISFLLVTFSGCVSKMPKPNETIPHTQQETEQTSEKSISLDEIPEFSGSPYVVINDNQPSFTKSDYTTKAFEKYASLDKLGRCGVTFANVCLETMPTEDRGNIGQVKPSGWVTAKYDFVDGRYLYNRCHLIGFQLTGENANTSNLITGTRYMNTQGMLPFENMIADYVKETENHVLYRVTPIFEGDNLVASGVQMEAWSVEDEGDGICFNVYCYNVQPGVTIDYATGKSHLAEEISTQEQDEILSQYVLNTSSKKIHKPTCSGAKNMSEKNKMVVNSDEIQSFVNNGYELCGSCLDR